MRGITVYRLSEKALTLSWEQHIDLSIHEQVMQVDLRLREKPFPGWIENVPAYQSLTVYFDPLAVHNSKSPSPVMPGIGPTRASIEGRAEPGAQGSGSPWWNMEPGVTALDTVEQYLKELLEQPVVTVKGHARQLKVPVCYDRSLSPDLEAAAGKLHISIEELVSLHTGTRYHVFMLGFMPGFPYMGILPAKLELPRKDVPSLQVPAGMVAIAGRQTGIYPFSSPGGWYGIGLTPLKIFSGGRPYFEPGDEVEFYAISTAAFREWNNQASVSWA